ncbi:hypothetical protein [Streptomyces sp. NBC_00271]|uniref:hypothetical protein n=1 Tax=Streptomyces sp. NBC_00271 TaxID=2975697 RepID=UPI002E2A3F00|nr:hypothetical protein [Streptomyces sp. NBC_00271]
MGGLLGEGFSFVMISGLLAQPDELDESLDVTGISGLPVDGLGCVMIPSTGAKECEVMKCSGVPCISGSLGKFQSLLMVSSPCPMLRKRDQSIDVASLSGFAIESLGPVRFPNRGTLARKLDKGARAADLTTAIEEVVGPLEARTRIGCLSKRSEVFGPCEVSAAAES